MKYRHIVLLSLAIIFAGICSAQPGNMTDSFKPASTNQPGKQYPQVNSEGRVRASIQAPQAQKIQLDIGGKKYDLIKDENGLWTGESLQKDEGFHYQIITPTK